MNRQGIFSLILVLVLGITGYLWYQYLRSSPGQEGESSRLAARLSEVSRFRNVQLDTSIFQDRFFNSLTLPQEAPELEVTPGRSNPFAPF